MASSADAAVLDDAYIPGAEPVAYTPAGGDGGAEDGEPARVAIPTSAEWDRHFAPREWLIGGWLPAGRFSLLTGTGGFGKSRLTLQLAANLADDGAGDGAPGPHWLYAGGDCGPVSFTGGDETHAPPVDAKRRGPVLIVTWEDECDEYGRRLAALERDGLARRGHVGGRLIVSDVRGLGPVWAPGAGTSGHVSTVGEITAVGEAVRREAEAAGAAAVVLDSLAGAYGSDENSRALVRAFVASWDKWASAHACAVLAVAHPPKSDASGYSGSTDWHNAARSRLRLGGAVIRGAAARGEDALLWPALSRDKANYAGGGRGRVWLDTSPSGVGWVAITEAAALALALRREAERRPQGAGGAADAPGGMPSAPA